jgi:hypothetical protein
MRLLPHKTKRTPSIYRYLSLLQFDSLPVLRKIIKHQPGQVHIRAGLLPSLPDYNTANNGGIVTLDSAGILDRGHTKEHGVVVLMIIRNAY